MLVVPQVLLPFWHADGLHPHFDQRSVIFDNLYQAKHELYMYAVDVVRKRVP